MNINKLIVQSFNNIGNFPTRHSFDKCYIPLVEIKDFSIVINNKPLFQQFITANKTRMKTCRNVKKNVDTTGNVLGYLYQ